MNSAFFFVPIPCNDVDGFARARVEYACGFTHPSGRRPAAVPPVRHHDRAKILIEELRLNVRLHLHKLHFGWVVDLKLGGGYTHRPYDSSEFSSMFSKWSSPS